MTSGRSTATASSCPQQLVSAFETRVSLGLALATQASNVSQRFFFELANETAKYVFPKRFESRNMEEALMAASHMQVVGIFGFTGEDHIGKISFLPLQAVPSFVIVHFLAYSLAKITSAA